MTLREGVFEIYAEPGARGHLVPIGYSPLSYGYIFVCDFCRERIQIDALEFEARSTALDISERLYMEIKRHSHVMPKPLTPEQREHVKIQMQHQRGALRCGSGSGG